MVDSSYVTYCRICNAKIGANSSFCTECGHSLKDNSGSDLICASCGENLDQEYLFCPECGMRVESLGTCPRCTAPIKPGTTSCTECGMNLDDHQNPDDDLLGEGEEDTDKTSPDRLENVKDRDAPEIDKKRYLVCGTCRGYYQLQKGEEPEDFSDECECGGKLECRDSRE